MTDDDILREIGKALTEPDALDDPRWEKLRQGRADTDQKSELAELENRHPHISGASEAFSPLASGFQTKLESLVRELDIRESENNVVALRPKPKQKFVTVLAGTIAAIAAAAVLVLVLQPETIPAIANYHYEFAGGERGMRGPESVEEDGTVASFTKTSLFEMRLRPEMAYANPIHVHAFLVGNGPTKKISLPYQLSQGGVITIRGRVSRLFPVDPGSYKLVLIVTTDVTADLQPIPPLSPGARRVSNERFEIVEPLVIRDGP